MTGPQYGGPSPQILRIVLIRFLVTTSSRCHADIISHLRFLNQYQKFQILHLDPSPLADFCLGPQLYLSTPDVFTNSVLAQIFYSLASAIFLYLHLGP